MRDGIKSNSTCPTSPVEPTARTILRLWGCRSTLIAVSVASTLVTACTRKRSSPQNSSCFCLLHSRLKRRLEVPCRKGVRLKCVTDTLGFLHYHRGVGRYGHTKNHFIHVSRCPPIVANQVPLYIRIVYTHKRSKFVSSLNKFMFPDTTSRDRGTSRRTSSHALYLPTVNSKRLFIIYTCTISYIPFTRLLLF